MKDEQAPMIDGPMREKYWSELGIEEKVERMRSIVRRQGDQLDRIETEFHSLRRQFANHEHNAKSEVVLPIDPGSKGGFGYSATEAPSRLRGSQDPNEVYF